MLPRKALVSVLKLVFHDSRKCLVCSSLNRNTREHFDMSDFCYMFYLYLQPNYATICGPNDKLQVNFLLKGASVTGLSRNCYNNAHYIPVTPNLLVCFMKMGSRLSV